MAKDDHTADACIRELGDRRELRISIDDELLWTRVYTRRFFVNLDDEAAAKGRDFVAMGWVVSS